jgi:two-component system, NtrC family, response regulator GlrR
VFYRSASADGSGVVFVVGRLHMPHRLLLIEHEQAHQASLAQLLTHERGFDCQRQLWESFEPETLKQSRPQLVVSIPPPHWQLSLRLTDWLRTHPIHAAILMVLPRQPDELLLRLAIETADDFLFCPVDDAELQCRVARILGASAGGKAAISGRLNQELGSEQLVGNDPAFLRAIEKLPALAVSKAPVLLLGETGTGKELCAHAIHSFGPRRAGPFVPVDCAALPDHLVENELFGHVRGAFTDAHSDQMGLAAMAAGGTLFLDEIDALPLPAQAKLLRFIQDGTYRPLGSQKYLHADVRLVVATNRDLEVSARKGDFRRDLYFRINVLPLRLPSLRDRRGDIVALAMHFVASIEDCGEKRFSPSALHLLQMYDWPGNVRELFNVVQRAAAFSDGVLILPAHLGLTDSWNSAEPLGGGLREARQRIIEGFERSYVEDILRRHGGNVTHAAV